MLGEAAADGASLLGPEIERLVFLILVRLPQHLLLLLGDHREHPRDREPHHLAAKPKKRNTVSAVGRWRSNAEIERHREITSWRACWGHRR